MTEKRTVLRPRGILGQGPRGMGILIGAAASVALLVVWFTASWLEWVKPLYLPPPWRVVEAAFDIQPNILVHASYTLALIVVGFGVGVAVGFAIGLLVRQSFLLRSILTPIIESSRPVPAVALIPFFILWFGFSWAGKAVLIAVGTFLIIAVGVMNSIDRLDPVYLRTALSFGGTNWKFLRFAALPAIMPAMLAPLRIALANATILAVASEYMGATRGLGYVINIALNTFSSHTILLCVMVLGVIGGGLDLALRTAHARLTTWAKAAEEAVDTYGGTYP